jgi:hypothetical protein
MASWTAGSPAISTAFLASLVEVAEAFMLNVRHPETFGR